VGTHSGGQGAVTIDSISAVTLATHDMARALRFYLALGFPLRYGGETAAFSSLSAGNACLNLTTEGSEREWSWWGRTIFYVSDVDAFYLNAFAKGLRPDSAPSDATWGERFFHITDPDGHELSFATPLPKR
jgi:catechol 2,3-dioxygenase-like lactoylglutathione lyase family enzyme